MHDQVTVGVVANPASGRDIRRLVAHGSAVTAHQKLNLLKRLAVGLGRAGVGRMLMMPDPDGIAVGLIDASDRPTAVGWPAIEVTEQTLTGTPADTSIATRRMLVEGVGAIVVLGGDGTHRLVALECGTTPLIAISTGTNNTFPRHLEPTVAGIAAGLVATGQLDIEAVAAPAKMLEVRSDDDHFPPERALVDVAILNTDRIGSGAVWEPGTIEELFLCFAPADAIGLSAIGGHLQPIGRDEPVGLAVRLAPDARESGDTAIQRLCTPIGPGLTAEVNVASCSKLPIDQPVKTATTSGTAAVDGERIARFHSALTVTLRADGPIVVDVAAAMDHAARSGLLSFDNNPNPEGGYS